MTTLEALMSSLNVLKRPSNANPATPPAVPGANAQTVNATTFREGSVFTRAMSQGMVSLYQSSVSQYAAVCVRAHR